MEWKLSKKPVDYPTALKAMEKRVSAILDGSEPEMAWLLEHPPLYTAGTSARPADVLGNAPFPVYETGRGGQVTYHGPGQRIGYIMLDLKKRSAAKTPDLRAYVQSLERWLIGTLGRFGVEGFTRDGRIGVWVNTETGESKIAALGIRVRKGISFHGVSINLDPDLSHYRGIIPCGIREYGVTSLAALGVKASMNDLDKALKTEFARTFS